MCSGRGPDGFYVYDRPRVKKFNIVNFPII